MTEYVVIDKNAIAELKVLLETMSDTRDFDAAISRFEVLKDERKKTKEATTPGNKKVLVKSKSAYSNTARIKRPK